MIQLLGLLNEVSSIANSSKGLEKNISEYEKIKINTMSKIVLTLFIKNNDKLTQLMTLARLL